LTATEFVINDAAGTVSTQIGSVHSTNAFFVKATHDVIETNVETRLGNGNIIVPSYSDVAGTTGKLSFVGEAQVSWAQWKDPTEMYVTSTGGATRGVWNISPAVVFAHPAENQKVGYALMSFVYPYNASVMGLTWWAHFVVDNTTAGDIRIKSDWILLHSGDTYSTSTVTTTYTGVNSIGTNGNGIFTMEGGGFPGFGPAGGPDDRLVVMFYRYDLARNDTYPGNMYLLGGGIRYNANQIGGVYNTFTT